MAPMLAALCAFLLSASLADAEAALQNGDPDAALPLLAAVEETGGLAYDDVLRLLVLRGTAQAFVNDTDGAVATFLRLLSFAPAQTLPYDASPRVTFAFEAARTAAARRRSLDFALVTPAVARLDEPVLITVVRRADVDAIVKRVTLWHRAKGVLTWSYVDAEVTRSSIALLLPARRSDAVEVDELGRPGVIVELALIGFDMHGSQVVLSPSPAHPIELPVGYDAPPPWYTNPWMWTGVVVASVVVAGATTASVLVANQPPDAVAVSSTVRR
jgi:hypothetical protein